MSNTVKEIHTTISVKKLCKNKTATEVLDMVREAKLNNASTITIQRMQQIADKKMKAEKEQRSRIVVGMTAWKSYCRQSILYRFLERIGLR
tara:strand:+ start:88 stop:360 length:273 start_codon:yes stop_codon:yes gene_type:complete